MIFNEAWFRFKRGLFKDLRLLDVGEPGLTLDKDDEKVFIGTGTKNLELMSRQQFESRIDNSEVLIYPTDTTEVIIQKLTTAPTTVKFLNGEHIISGASGVKKITITKSIRISGHKAIVYLERGMQIELSSPFIEISGIEFRVRDTGTLSGGESCLLIRRSNIKIDNCKFGGSRFYHGIFIGDDVLKTCDDVQITNCSFDVLGYGILKQMGAGSTAHRLLIANNHFTNIQRGDAIELNMGVDIGYMIADNYIDGVIDGGIANAGIGIGIAGGVYGVEANKQTREGYIINNIVKNTQRSGIHVEACNQFHIVGNTVSNAVMGATFGIEVYGSTEMTVDANYISNFRRGIVDDLGVYGDDYIVSTNNNYITRNNIENCTIGIDLGATGEAKVQYCVGNFLKNCATGINVYGKAIFNIMDNELDDCDIPFNVDYEPIWKEYLFPVRYRYISILNNTTRFNGLLGDNLKSTISLEKYDKMEFDRNNFKLGPFVRKPRTFSSDEKPLYYVKGDVITSVVGTKVTKQIALSNGYAPLINSTYYFRCVAGNDYIHIVSPGHANDKYMLGQTIVLEGAGVGGADLVTIIKDMYIASSEYRIRLTNKIETTVSSATELKLLEVATFRDEEGIETALDAVDRLSQVVNQIALDTVSETIIEVGATKAFKTVTSAIDSITDNSPLKRYKIKVYDGTYAERILLKPYVGVEGVNREAVIFELDRPLSTPDASVTSDSMVELHYVGSYIRDITVKGSNFRYMVHIEFGSNSGISVEVSNCIIEHKGNDASFTWGLPHAVGAGLGSADTTINLKNSTFIGGRNGRGVLIHDNASPTEPSVVNIEGCKIFTGGGNTYEGLNLDNYSVYTGTIPWYINLNNNVIQVGPSVTGTVNRARLLGGGNTMSRYYSSEGNWVDSTAGVYLKNNTGAIIPRGTALFIDGEERAFDDVFDGTRYSGYARFGGFAIRDIPVDGFGWAVRKGAVQVLFGDTTNYMDTVMIATDGTVIKYDEETAERRMPIGQLLQPSANAGELRRVALVDNISTLVIPNSILRKGKNVVRYAWGGAPLNYPSYIGQFAVDTVDGNAVWIALGWELADWKKLT